MTGYNSLGGTNYCQETTKRWDHVPEWRGRLCGRSCDPGETVCRVHLAARRRSQR